jgi:cytochrome oxidase Cu insertion factor (SCO1/SenC/PrrC family)
VNGDRRILRAGWLRAARAAVLLLALLVAAAPAVPRAHADGDPASDYLWSQSIYVPVGTSSTARAQLQAVVDAARAGALPVKVAVIGSAYDLGSLTPLWRRPQSYARFLGAELSNRFHGLLLVAMPNGFGVYRGGGSVTSELQALRSLTPTGGTSGLLASAATAVRSIAAVDGHPIAAVPKAPAAAPGTSSGVGARVVVAGIAGLLVLIGLVGAIVRRRLRRQRPVVASPAVPDAADDGVPLPRRARLAGSYRAVMLVLGLVVVVAAVADAQSFGYLHWRSSSPAAPVASAKGITWPAHQRRAPSFVLRDQNGRPVTPRAGGSSLTILAFVDPVCRQLCPLEAAVLGNVARALPAASRPAIVAVSVNPWGNARANLVGDIHKWRTGPSWRWAVGPRKQLERVWQSYQVGVLAKDVRVAGTTVHEMAHDEMIYIVDGSGYERVVWPWPFTAAELRDSIHRLQTSAA